MSLPRAARAPQLELWHMGAVVRDLEAAIRDEMLLGAAGHSATARLDGDTYDAETGHVVREILDVAWVARGAGRGTLELIRPVLADGPGPQARLLRQRPGPSHSAYWCDDLIETATWLTAQGAELVLAPLAGRPGEHRGLQAPGLEALLAVSLTCYLRLGGGELVELNPIASRAGLLHLWGHGVLDHIPTPRLYWNAATRDVET